MSDQIPVRVFHTDIFSRFRSADEGGPVVLVFSSTASADRDPLEICDEMFELLNVGHDAEFGTPDPRAIDYRNQGHRGLSVGDIVQVGATYYEIGPVGFTIVAPPSGIRSPAPEYPDPPRAAPPTSQSAPAFAMRTRGRGARGRPPAGPTTPPTKGRPT
ncbi:hypothetical protein [Thermomonospora umbrina]|uniref:Uncharacterized protein n=1 Tax=Thermomonospora umbrina TaxID=111806 RepID=A0A3D9T9Q0_9ACTN|nr:hypothetical protein [Thermomonospora umbrina]REF00492.1 hypothetical protein DFJ69_6036 [Thermomonospora umbrina]